ncbi:MAG: hypothetical protein EHM21_03390 [Chloroflexi bacterium]|nr:MAG: hypothetical protein EHM21_03390 [Chloroflexota bacterium]
MPTETINSIDDYIDFLEATIETWSPEQRTAFAAGMAAQFNGQNWRARLGDFPDDYVYYLVIDGEVAGGFHDWPETWRRD